MNNGPNRLGHHCLEIQSEIQKGRELCNHPRFLVRLLNVSLR